MRCLLHVLIQMENDMALTKEQIHDVTTKVGRRRHVLVKLVNLPLRMWMIEGCGALDQKSISRSCPLPVILLDRTAD